MLPKVNNLHGGWRTTLVVNTAKLIASFLFLSILLAPASTHNRERERSEPEFDIQLPNFTIKLGSDAAFTCIVKHLGEYKVAWIRSEDKKIIALHNHMVTHNNRYSVTHNGHNTWTLHIKNVQQNDTGSYMCQINTDPQRSQYGTLEVVVPADIVDEETSNDVIVSEGQSATLKCKATGYPQPKVKWRRENNHPLPLSKDLLTNPTEKIEVWEGESLPMRPLQRTDTGPYLCIANNSVPPLVSKRVMVFVHFHPLIKVSNQLVAAPVGINVTLECYVEAVPRPVVSWFNKEGQLILNQAGRVWQDTEPLKEYSMKMKLTLSHLRKDDFTEYNCTAGNSLGTSYALIKLQQLHPPPTMKTTTTTTSPGDWRMMKHSKHNNNENERDPNGNPIKHGNKGHKNKANRQRPEHHHDDFDLIEGEVLLGGEGLTTSSSLGSGSGGGLSKRNQKDSPPPNNRRLDTSKFPHGSTSSAPRCTSLLVKDEWAQQLHKCCLPLIISFLRLLLNLFNNTF